MSAFVCILHRDGSPVDPVQLRRLATALEVRSEAAILCRGAVGVAIVPTGRSGRVGRTAADPRSGPWLDPSTGTVAVVAGRWSAVADGTLRGETAARELAEVIGATAAGRSDESSARVAGSSTSVLASLLTGVAGAFAALVTQPHRSLLLIARDHLGSVPVHYAVAGRLLLAASDPAVLLRHPAVSDAPDEVAAARFLGFRFGATGRSFYADVRTLPPGHLLRVGRDAVEEIPYWRFRRQPEAVELPPDGVAEEFRRHLAAAVRRDTSDRPPQELALSLSGGLDSTAVAAFAPTGTRAFTWTFRATPEADEVERATAVADHLGLHLTRVPGDGLHPLCDGFAERFVDLASPEVNPFAALKCRLYEAAREAGCRRVLVGDGGDAVYAAREMWLRDLLAARGEGALGSLATALRRAAGGDRFARTALRRLLPAGLRLPLRRALGRERPPWLTAEALALLPDHAPSSTLPPGPRAARFELAAGPKHTELEVLDRRLFYHCGVERANPFWSWPLLAWTVSLPAHWFYRDGLDKPLARRALRGHLPPVVLEGGPVGLLGSVFLRGLDLHRDEVRELVFRQPRSDWRRYVRRDRVEPYLDTRRLGFGHTVLWRVISYELWHRRRVAGGGERGG